MNEADIFVVAALTFAGVPTNAMNPAGIMAGGAAAFAGLTSGAPPQIREQGADRGHEQTQHLGDCGVVIHQSPGI